MNKCILLVAFLFTLMCASTASARELTAVCDGTVIVTIGVDGPDTMTAVQAKFTMKMKGKTSTFTLENKYAKPITGTGTESGNDDKPWNLQGKDADGMAFKGHFTAIKPTYPGDRTLHILLELKSKKLLVSGPLSCSMK